MEIRKFRFLFFAKIKEMYPDFPLELNEEDTNSNDIKLGSRNVRKWYDYFIEKNKTFILIMAFITIVQIILIYFGGTMFRTKSLTLFEFLVMLILAITVIPIDSFRKFVYKKKYGTENV